MVDEGPFELVHLFFDGFIDVFFLDLIQRFTVVTQLSFELFVDLEPSSCRRRESVTDIALRVISASKRSRSALVCQLVHTFVV